MTTSIDTIPTPFTDAMSATDYRLLSADDRLMLAIVDRCSIVYFNEKVAARVYFDDAARLLERDKREVLRLLESLEDFNAIRLTVRSAWKSVVCVPASQGVVCIDPPPYRRIFPRRGGTA